MTSPTKTQIVGWCLFDFAASFLMANGGLYFPPWIVIDNKVPDLFLNVTFAVSTALVLIMAPIVGAIGDRLKRPALLLKLSALLMLSSPIALFIIDHNVSNHRDREIYSLTALLVVLSAYQFAAVFYNSVLKKISNNKTYRTISGLGVAANWLGAVVGILAVLPFVTGAVPGLPAGKGEAFLPSAIAFAVLAGISFALMPRDSELRSSPEESSADSKMRTPVLRAIRMRGELFWFLIAFALFMDAILTIQNNLPIYLHKAIGLTDQPVAMLFLVLFLSAALGGLLSIPLLRSLKPIKVLALSMVLWSALLVSMALTSGFALYAAWFAAAGFLFGTCTNAGRVMYLRLVPPAQAGEYFGIYNSFERTASILGPLVWGGVVTGLAAYGDQVRYRTALGAMAVFTVLATLALWRLAMQQRRRG